MTSSISATQISKANSSRLFKMDCSKNYTHSFALSDSDISPICQMFLTLLLAVPLRTEVLSLHLSLVSHRLKNLSVTSRDTC